MTEFNDPMKNQAIETIAYVLQNPEGDMRHQLAQILEIVQNACCDEGNLRDEKAIRFFEPYIASLKQCSIEDLPDFLDGIVTSVSSLTISNVAQFLARLRCDAVKDSDSELIINDLTYLIEYLKSEYNAITHVCKKCYIPYADYRDKVLEVIKWAFEAYNAPIYLKFDSNEEWTDFRKQTIDEKHSSYKYSSASFVKSKNIDSSVFPLVVRIDKIMRLSDEMLNIPQAEIDEFWKKQREHKVNSLSMLDDKIENALRKHKKLILSVSLVLVFVIAFFSMPFKHNLQDIRKEIHSYSISAFESLQTQEEETSNHPNWLVKYGPWRAGLDDSVIMEINLRSNYVWYTRAFVTISKTDIEYWTVQGNVLYIRCEDKNEYACYVDNNTQNLYTTGGTEFEPFIPQGLWH